MLYNNLIFFLVAIFVFSTHTPADKPLLPPVWTFVFLGIALASYAIAAKRVFAGAVGSKGYFAAEKRLSLLAALLFAGFVYLLDIKYYLAPLSFKGAMPVITDIAGLACFFILLGIMWSKGRVQYGRLFHRHYSSAAFVATNFKINLPVVLPWLMVSLLFDLLRILPFSQLQQLLRSPWGDGLLFVLFIVVLTLLFPPLVRSLWGCRPLPPGPLSNHIGRLCAGQAFRAEVLLWPLFEGQVLTAAIMGIVPGLRYLLLTPALIETLTSEELDSVIAHEIGHVKRLHLVLYIGLFLGFSLLAGAVTALLPHYVLLGDLYYTMLAILPVAPETVLALFVSAPVLVLLLIYFRYIFGFFIRNFERQADLHVFQVQGTSAAIISSFEKIASLSDGEREEKNWHHFGIGERIRFLESCERDRSLLARHDRKLRSGLLVYFAVVCLLSFGLHQIDTEQLIARYEVKYTEAVLMQKVRLDPENSKLLTFLGDFLQSRDLEKRAVAAYEKALTLDPDNPEVNNNLAWLLLTAKDASLHDAARALELAKKAVREKEQGAILDTLATAYWATGQPYMAIELELKAAALDPKNRGYYQAQIDRFKKTKWRDS